MLTEKQLSDFARDGFVNGGKVLNDGELEKLTFALDEIIGRGPGGFSETNKGPVSFKNISGNNECPVWQIVNIWEASKVFERLIYNSDIVQGISLLTGEGDLMVWHDQVQYKPAQYGGATTWHQDAPLWPIIRPMTPVSAWIPFDDADEVMDAYAEAKAEAKAQISDFMQTKIAKDCERKSAKLSRTLMSKDPEGNESKNVNIEKIKTTLCSTVESTEAILKGVVDVGRCYTPGKFVKLTIGIKPETIVSASRLNQNMKNSSKNSGSGFSSNNSGSNSSGFNSMDGYSDYNSDF